MWIFTAVVGISGRPDVAAAQDEVRVMRECRCGDDDQETHRECVCLRVPSADAIRAQILPRIMGRARLGITLTAVRGESADPRGVVIQEVMDDGPADEAGLREGDVIVRLAGHDLERPLDPGIEDEFDEDVDLPMQRLVALVREMEPGEQVEVAYLREGRETTVTVTTEDIPRWRSVRIAPSALGPGILHGMEGVRSGLAFAFGGAPAGVEVVEMNSGLGSYFGADEGVLVVAVEEDSRLGLEAGDVVLDVDGREVKGVARFHRILTSYGPDEEVRMRVLRKGREIQVLGRVGRD